MLAKIGIIIALNFALYWRTLSFKFVSDDFSVFKNPPVFKNAWHKAWLRFIGAAKCLTPSIRLVWTNGKPFIVVIKTEWFEHFLAIFIHTLICLSIFWAFGLNEVSFVAAILYSVNPFNNQGTIWPGGRGYALPILMILLSMCIPWLSPIFLGFCAWFTVGFLAPLAFVGSSKWGLLAVMPLVWGFHARKFTKAVKNKAATETFTEDRIIHPKKLILGVKTFGFYTIMCIVPFRITFYHNFLQSAAGSLKHKCYTFCRYFWIGAATITAFVAYWVLVPWNTLSWAFLAYAITIAPFCNMIRANQEIAERFAALPNVFLMYALAQILLAIPVYGSYLVVAFAAYYATRAFHTLTLYKDEYFITECAVIEDPYAWWAWHCRAMKRWDMQSYKEALTLWVMARMISPREFKILMNLATCVRMLGNGAEADALLKEAEANIVPGQEAQAMEFIENHRKGKLPILL